MPPSRREKSEAGKAEGSRSEGGLGWKQMVLIALMCLIVMYLMYSFTGGRSNNSSSKSSRKKSVGGDDGDLGAADPPPPPPPPVLSSRKKRQRYTRERSEDTGRRAGSVPPPPPPTRPQQIKQQQSSDDLLDTTPTTPPIPTTSSSSTTTITRNVERNTYARRRKFQKDESTGGYAGAGAGGGAAAGGAGGLPSVVETAKNLASPVLPGRRRKFVREGDIGGGNDNNNNNNNNRPAGLGVGGSNAVPATSTTTTGSVDQEELAKSYKSSFPPPDVDFTFPPEPAGITSLPGSLADPKTWKSGEWGPVKQKVRWGESTLGAEGPLFRREQKFIREKKLYPDHPIPSLRGGDVLYARHLADFREASDAEEAKMRVLEIGLHDASAARPPLNKFFAGYLPKAKYTLSTDKTPPAAADQKVATVASPSATPSKESLDTISDEMNSAVDIIVGRVAEGGIAAQRDTFRYLFVNLLKPGGVYFLEDIDMNFLFENTEVDALTKERTLLTDYIRDAMCSQINHDWGWGYYSGQYRADGFVNNWVEDVSCARGVCSFVKKLVPFNRMANLVHDMPAYNPSAPVRRSAWPTPVLSLDIMDKTPSTLMSHFGPMQQPVRGGIHQQLPLWGVEANKFKLFSDTALSDKAAAVANGHQYHAFYAKWFAPYREALPRKYFQYLPGDGKDPTGYLSASTNKKVKKEFKMMEIGIGCDMLWTPGGGYRLYRQYIPNVEYNAFEFQWPVCKRKYSQESPQLQRNIHYFEGGEHVAHGDQSKYSDLKKAIEKFGPLDIFVDDGSHEPSHQMSTFREMFIAGVKPDGIFMMEDVQTTFFKPKSEQIERLNFVELTRDLVISLNNPSWLPQYSYKPSESKSYRADEPVTNWLEDFGVAREMMAFQKLLKPFSSKFASTPSNDDDQ